MTETYPKKPLDDNEVSAWILEFTRTAHFDERTHRCRLGDLCRTKERPNGMGVRANELQR